MTLEGLKDFSTKVGVGFFELSREELILKLMQEAR